MLVLAACGADAGRQDAEEPQGGFPVRITNVSFPAEQRLADRAQFVIEVRNTGDRTIPNIAVTLDGLERPEQKRAGRQRPIFAPRPVWVVEGGPEGGETTYVNTWAKGTLAPGRTARFVWDVTAVEAGRHRLRYRVSAGLVGEARAVGADGRTPSGAVTVAIRPQPADARVEPQTGEVLRGPGRDVRTDEPPDPDEPLHLFDGGDE